MAATARDSAAAGPAPPPAIGPPSPPAIGPPAPPTIPAQFLHKNRLQEFAQRAHMKLPVYNIESVGDPHLPKFRCTVEVGGQLFSSTQGFSRRKEAEQDAARVACETLVTRDKGDVKDFIQLIDQGVVFCKTILHEFSVKMRTTRPSYSVASQTKPVTHFVASVVFDGSTYTGEVATSKKDAEQKAAHVAVKSILATGNTCMMGIIGSKENLITAINSSRNSKGTATVSQKVCNTPTKALATFTPIKFTRPAAYTEYGGRDHVAPKSQDQSSSLVTTQEFNIVPPVDPSANPSANVVTHSRKRKGTDGSDVNERKD